MEVLYTHNEVIHNYAAAEVVLPIVFSVVRPKSVLDVGCGLGTWLKVAKDLGTKEVVGVDGAYVDQTLLKIQSQEFFTADLRKELTLSKKFDLLICLEVAEHLPEECSDTFIRSLTKHADVILFSAAIPQQDGQNHINEKPFAFWQKLFLKYGFEMADCIRPAIWENKKVEWWYRQNTFLVIRNGILENIERVKGELMTSVHPERYSEVFTALQSYYAKSQTAEEATGINAGSKTALLKRLYKKVIG